MTGPDNNDTRPISVAELLARNGTIGAPPVGGRRRLRRGNTDSVTVAELTGEIPIIGAEDVEPGAAGTAATTNGTVGSATEGAFPASDVPAEEMLPDPGYADADDDDEHAELAVQERDFDEYDESHLDEIDESHLDEIDEPPSYLHAVREPLFGGRFEDDLRRDGPRPRDEPYPRDRVRRQVRSATAGARDHREDEPPPRMQQIGRGALIVVQSMLAVAFGAGLFIAFDELWKWNNIVALVLSVLVILGLVVGVRIVRKTEDIASTLIAVAVGALVTLGPLALLQSG